MRMQRVSSGYTIVEVTIFLAISGVLLLSSFAFLSGAQARNRFSQAMRDTQSKIQDVLNDVPTGFAGGTKDTTGLSCKRVAAGGPDHPKFNTGAGTNNGECVFLGKAIQFTDKNSPPLPGQESLIYTYSVFGLRNYTPIAEDERPVANLVEASPIAAVDIASYSGSGDLTDVYTIPGGAKVKKIIKSSGVVSNDSHMAGFFLSFNQLSANNSGSSNLRAYQYPIAGNAFPGNIQTGTDYRAVDECISLTNKGPSDCSTTSVSPVAPNDSWPPNLTDWEICFENESNNSTAVLTISSANGLNPSTKLEFKDCY
jgi:type II secretory pathway pseudopilin PulG